MKSASGHVPTVFYSGGIDSEVVIRSFLELGVKPHVVTAIILDSNAEDVTMATRFCFDNGLRQEFITLDPKRWVDEFFFAKIEEYNCFWLHTMFYAWMLETVDPDFPVFGCGTIGSGLKDPYRVHFERREEDFFVLENDYFLSIYLWLDRKKRNGCPRFWIYTPELIQAYLTHPLVEFYLRDYDRLSRSTPSIEDWKFMIYHLHYDMPRRTKWSGWEAFTGSSYFRDVLRRLAARYPLKPNTYHQEMSLRQIVDQTAWKTEAVCPTRAG